MRLAYLALVSSAFVACRIGYDPLQGSPASGGEFGASGGLTEFVGDAGTGSSSGNTAQGGSASSSSGLGGRSTSSAGASSAGGSTSTAGMSSAGGSASTAGTSSAGGASTAGTSSAGGAGGAGTAGTSSAGSAGTAGAGGCVPTGAEVCDGLDNDCSGTADNGGVCPAGCTGATYGGHRYTFCVDPLTWAAADASCKAQGLLLVRIDGAAELAWVKSTAFAPVGANNSNTYWRWIGANDQAVSGEWRWLDGVQFWQGSQTGGPVGGLFSSWSTAQPGKDTCAEMENGASTSFWTSMPCTNSQPYVCKLY